jgi:hypothetical protein
MASRPAWVLAANTWTTLRTLVMKRPADVGAARFGRGRGLVNPQRAGSRPDRKPVSFSSVNRAAISSKVSLNLRTNRSKIGDHCEIVGAHEEGVD